jgi:hypothetical protein
VDTEAVERAKLMLTVAAAELGDDKDTLTFHVHAQIHGVELPDRNLQPGS